jgi:hypothetical protein
MILESASVCPACRHHLRFDPNAAARGASAEGTSALRIEGTVQHPAGRAPVEYSVVVSIKDDRGQEVARQVVGVGALQPNDIRTFTLSVDVFSPEG